MQSEAEFFKTYCRNWRNYHREHGRAVSIISAVRYYIPWRASLQPGRSPLADRVPWVVYSASKVIGPLAKAGTKVFEYGMGGSTLFFLDAGCMVVSVDHDYQWSEKLQGAVGQSARWTSRFVAPKLDDDKAADLACKSEWPGFEHADFAEYVNSIRDYPEEFFDIVLVDGRARPSALKTAAPRVRRGGVLILDNAERSHYQETIRDLQKSGWRTARYFGPGPYVRARFWDTLLLRAPSNVPS